jgi:aspartate 1-decarboxylase
MQLVMLKSKLHKATVTGAALDYVGSLTIDRDLMDEVKILPHEKILVANLANGNRFETYAIPAPPGSGVICLNGAAAHQGKIGDRIIILAFCLMSPDEAVRHRPLVLILDERNKPVGGLVEV